MMIELLSLQRSFEFMKPVILVLFCALWQRVFRRRLYAREDVGGGPRSY